MSMLDWSPRAWKLVRAILTFATAAIVAGVYTPAHAGTVTTTGKAPSKYTDGTTIDAPIKYRLEGSYDGQPLITVLSDTPTFKLTDMIAGHWCNRMIAVVNNVDADPSEQACVTVPGPNQPPPPPAKKPNPAYGITTTAAP